MSRILSYGQFQANTPNPPHQLKLPGMEQLGTKPVDVAPGRSFLRFGQWPADERSRNHATGGKEFGVSAYELHPHTNMPMDPDPDWHSDGAEWALDGMKNRTRDFHRGIHHGYEVRGNDGNGFGHDGEPLLTKVKHVRDWDGGADRRHQQWEDER